MEQMPLTCSENPPRPPQHGDRGTPQRILRRLWYENHKQLPEVWAAPQCCPKCCHETPAPSAGDEIVEITGLREALDIFIATRGKHDGPHVYDPTVQTCQACEQAGTSKQRQNLTPPSLAPRRRSQLRRPNGGWCSELRETHGPCLCAGHGKIAPRTIGMARSGAVPSRSRASRPYLFGG